MGIPFSLSWNFIKGLRFFLFFPSQASAKPGLCLAPGNMQRHAPGCFASSLTALIFCTVSRARNQIPAASAWEWNKQLEEEQGSCKHWEPWRLCGRPWAPSASGSLVLRALANNKRSAIGGSLYLDYSKRKKKKTYVKWALYMLFTHLAGPPLKLK